MDSTFFTALILVPAVITWGIATVLDRYLLHRANQIGIRSSDRLPIPRLVSIISAGTGYVYPDLFSTQVAAVLMVPVYLIALNLGCNAGTAFRISWGGALLTMFLLPRVLWRWKPSR